jgi:hypothetical protein
MLNSENEAFTLLRILVNILYSMLQLIVGHLWITNGMLYLES